jgi:hypothetical protein
MHYDIERENWRRKLELMRDPPNRDEYGKFKKVEYTPHEEKRETAPHIEKIQRYEKTTEPRNSC